MKDVSVSVIIPTYEEKDNISPLLHRISKSLDRLDYEIIVVDDNSSDGTAQEVEKLSGMYPVKLINRKGEKGLAISVVDGFKHASGNILVVMDADLQHPPEKIMCLVEEIQQGADIVVGSRYNQKNGFGEFAPIRKTMSVCANLLARILIRKLSDVKDIQSGFFALRRDVIKNVDLKPVGYKILLEILAVGRYKSVKEIGFTFSRRESGKSKLGAGTVFDYVRHIVLLSCRSGEMVRFLKYCIIGISGILVNTFALYFFTKVFGVFYIVSSAAAYELSILTNFIVNDRWTFGDLIGKSNDFLTRAVYYNGAMVLGAVFGIVLLWIFTEFLNVNYIISNLVSILLVTVWRYYTSITTVWRGEYNIHKDD